MTLRVDVVYLRRRAPPAATNSRRRCPWSACARASGS